MGRDKNFHDYIMTDVFSEISGITSKPMFSGYGIYFYGRIFALIIDGVIYFKVNENNLNDFLERGSAQFTYKNKNGKEVKMPYYSIPEEVMENKEEILDWVKKATRIF